MKIIRMAHLYYDLLNLYGESGNVRALKKHLEQNNITVIITFLTVGDRIDFSKYDIFYLGSGSKENFHIVRKDILKYKEEIRKAIDSGKYFFVTGSSLNLFGSFYQELNKESYPVLNLLNFSVYERKKAIVGDVFLKMDGFSYLILGFQNRFTKISNIKERYLFHSVNSSIFSSGKEGIVKNNFYGTYLLGPIFIRNPYLLAFFVKKILEEKNIVYQSCFYNCEISAYQTYLKYFYLKKLNYK